MILNRTYNDTKSYVQCMILSRYNEIKAVITSRTYKVMGRYYDISKVV